MNNFIRNRALRMIATVSLIIGIPFASSYITVFAESDPATVQVLNSQTPTTPTPTPTPASTATPSTTASGTTSSTVDYTAGDAVPSSVTGQKVDGSATAVDYTYQGEKKFYTFVTKDGNTYYLIVDNEKANNNVYFLTEINDSQLSVNGSNGASSGTDNYVPTPYPTASATPAPATKKDSSWVMYVILIAGLGVGVYFFKVKPMQEAKNKKGKDDDEFDPDLVENEEEEEDEEND